MTKCTAGLVVSLIIISLTSPQQARADRSRDLSAKWHKGGSDVLSGFFNMYQPHVIHEPGAEYPFKMWFFGWSTAIGNPGYPGCDAIFHARAKNLDKWEVYAGGEKWDASMNPTLWAPVLTADDAIYDSWHAGDPSVAMKDGLYYMAYSSTGHDKDGIEAGYPGDTDNDLCCIMGATSPDGIHWTKTKRPILIYAPEVGLRGQGILGVTEYGMYLRPSLMFDEGKWKCWFDYKSPRSTAMGYAECPADRFVDATAWRIIRAGDKPALESWPNPDVIRVGGRYYSYADPHGFDPHPWKGRRICEAVSDDGIDWKVTGHIPTDPDTPATHVPEALVLEENGKKKIVLFYSCQVGGEPYSYYYNRIRYMWRYE